MNILAIGAHPDDIETSCGGTLAKFASQGHKVFTATATNGNVGSATLPMDEIAAIRKEEARKAAACIGAEYICLDYDDEMFFEDKNARLAFIDLVRYCKADIILTSDQEQVTQSLTFADGGPFDVQVSGDVDYIGGEVSLDVTGNSYGSYTLQLATGGWIYQTSTGVDGHYTVDYNSGAERTASVVYTINTNDASANGAITYTK